MRGSLEEVAVKGTSATRSRASSEAPVKRSDSGVFVTCAAEVTVTCDTREPTIKGARMGRRAGTTAVAAEPKRRVEAVVTVIVSEAVA